MKISIRSDGDPTSTEVIHQDLDFPTMVYVEASDGQVFQIIERRRGHIELSAVKNKKDHAAALTILPRSSNLVEIRATRL